MANGTHQSNTLKINRSVELRGDLGLESRMVLPGDKSLSHRAALFAALALGESRIENYLISGVTQAMLGALDDLGVQWTIDGRTLVVRGVGLNGLHKHSENAFPRINCGNSATTMRLLSGACATWNNGVVLDGSEGLRRRPMQRIVVPLNQMGVDIQSSEGVAPLTIRPVELPLQSISYTLPVASAQVKSCLLLAGLSSNGPVVLREPGPSRDHTERMLRSMGVTVNSELVQSESDGKTEYLTTLSPPSSKRLSPLQMTLPGDISAASFLIVAALITPNSELKLHGVGLNPTRTGILDALSQMGGNIQILNQSEQAGEPVGDLIVRHSQLNGIRVLGDLVVRMIDEFPVFAIAAAYAKGKTVVRDALELRHKESDRIQMLCRELTAIGVQVREAPDGFDITGGAPIYGGDVDPHGDHRLAMALAVAGLAAEGQVAIKDAQIINESFPNFVDIMQNLGAKIVLDQGI